MINPDISRFKIAREISGLKDNLLSQLGDLPECILTK